jgi:hypothetical protein
MGDFFCDEKPIVIDIRKGSCRDRLKAYSEEAGYELAFIDYCGSINIFSEWLRGGAALLQ